MLAKSDVRKLYLEVLANNKLKKYLIKDNSRTNKLENNGNGLIFFERIKIINLFAIIITSIIICRLIYLNTFNNNFLADQMSTRVLRTIKITPMRGLIQDRNQNPLAISTPVDSIWADPSLITNLDMQKLSALSKLLQISIADLNVKLNQKTKTFIYLKRAVAPEIAQNIKNLDIDGIYSIQEYKRFYPNANITAHVVGFTNIDDNGSEGIEYVNNNKLLGSVGQESVLKDRQGHIIQTIGKTVPAKNGENITLSIDNKIQYIAYNALKTQVEKSAADGGAAVVLDSKTGEVLAMVNMPTYNPNNRDKTTLDAIRNRAAIDIYEPGSIIKPLVIAKAIEDKIVTENTVFNTMPYYVGPKLIRDTHDHPSLNVAQIIQYSSDVGASKIGMKYKAKDLWQYYSDIGFGSKVGTNFPGEASGILRPWNKWYPIDQAIMSFGYGVSVSLLQMARAYTLFTNNGCLLPITFYKIENDTQNNHDNNNLACNQIISSNTAKLLQNILTTTVNEGTGTNAQTAEYTTAGKTGTAHKAIAHGYAKNQYYGSFVGFAPAKSNPRLIIAVTIDNPRKGGYYGGTVAAPVFSAIASPALHLLGVAPDKESPITVDANKNKIINKMINTITQ